MSKYSGPRLGSRRFRLKDDDWWGYAFIFVAMLVFCVFTLYPVLSAVKTSFLKYKPFGSEFWAEKLLPANAPQECYMTHK